MKCTVHIIPRTFEPAFGDNDLKLAVKDNIFMHCWVLRIIVCVVVNTCLQFIPFMHWILLWKNVLAFSIVFQHLNASCSWIYSSQNFLPLSQLLGHYIASYWVSVSGSPSWVSFEVSIVSSFFRILTIYMLWWHHIVFIFIRYSSIAQKHTRETAVLNLAMGLRKQDHPIAAANA